jgi:hypothetical protein
LQWPHPAFADIKNVGDCPPSSLNRRTATIQYFAAGKATQSVASDEKADSNCDTFLLQRAEPVSRANGLQPLRAISNTKTSKIT